MRDRRPACISAAQTGVTRRLEFKPCTGFVHPGGFMLGWSMGQMIEQGFGPFGRADLHARRNKLHRQGRLTPQARRHRQLAGVAAPTRGQIGGRPTPACKVLANDPVDPLLGRFPVVFPCLSPTGPSVNVTGRGAAGQHARKPPEAGIAASRGSSHPASRLPATHWLPTGYLLANR